MTRSSLLTFVVVAAACGRPAPSARRDAAPEVVAVGATDAAPAPDATPTTIDLAGLYDGDACVLVRYPDTTLRQNDPARCAEPVRPASTFKIVNALIGADAGLLAGPDAVMTYDRKRYPRQAHWPADWAQDQPLRTAMEISAVPLFQRLATQIGEDRMHMALDVLGYGNRKLTAPLDRFWLEGPFAVTAAQQIALITGLVTNRLPMTPAAQAIVREVIPRETAPDGAVLHFKTGTAPLDDGPWIAWLVGWIDRDGQQIEYACWIKHPAADVDVIRARRIEVCRGALDRLGLFPAPPA